jgi:hypothetical protein
MSEDEVAVLINELKRLQVRESQVIALLEEATNERYAEKPPRTAAGAAPRKPAAPQSKYTPVFKRGDRVIVTSRVKKPNTWPKGSKEWDATLARKARVKFVYADSDRIEIVDDNGWHTWRLSTNLKHEQPGL